MARSASSQYESNGTGADAEALDQRVRRLELAVAALQDTQLMEDRVVERVARRVEHHAPANGSNPLSSSAALIVNATKMLLPKSADGAPPADHEVLPEDPAAVKPTWFLWDLFRELRTMVRMFYDYRFRMSWTGRVMPLTGLVLFVLAWLLLPTNFLGLWGLLTQAVTAVIAVVVYKALAREVVRYNDLLMRIRYRS